MTEQPVKKSSDKKTFNFLQKDIHHWIIKADELLIVADKLETDIEENEVNRINIRIRYVYFMLIGFALECYYKSLIIARLLKEGKPIKSDELDPRIKKHDLEDLVLDAGVKVVGDQPKVLKYLTECVKWRGRYPTPSFACAIEGSIEYYSPNNDENYFLTTLDPIITIDELHELISEAINQIKGLGVWKQSGTKRKVNLRQSSH